MENSHIFEDPSKLSVSQKVLSAVKPKYFCEKKSGELHSKCAITVHRLASKRTVNHVHTTLEKHFIALFVQGVPLIFPHHDISNIIAIILVKNFIQFSKVQCSGHKYARKFQKTYIFLVHFFLIIYRIHVFKKDLSKAQDETGELVRTN